MSSPIPSRLSAIAAALLSTVYAFVPAPALAVTYSVGSGAGCTHATIQAAIDTAASSAGTDTIHLTNGSFAQQALGISSQGVSIVGGFDTCTTPVATGVTEINGAGGAANSVITITGNSSPVTLARLKITGGDETTDGDGGGIDVSGPSVVTLTDVEISGNTAQDGGGIAIRNAASVTLGPNVTIVNNTATGSGGGISVDFATLKAEADGILIAFNHAPNGYGGGLYVSYSRNVDIGSPGGLGLPVIYFNDAEYGGGIAVRAGTLSALPALVRLYSTDPTRPVRISANSASKTGGGVYLRPYFNVDLNNATSTLCASDFRIDDNDAVQGSAIYADSDYSLANDLRSTEVFLNAPTSCAGIAARPPSARSCIGQPDCNLIDNNYASGDATPANGATILLQNAGYLDARNLTLRDNVGGHAFRAFGDADDGTGRRAAVLLRGCAIFDNMYSLEALRFEGDRVSSLLEQCTVAGNTVGGAALIRFGGASETALTLSRSILWQPGTPLRGGTMPGALSVNGIVASALTTLPGATDAIVADPRFVGNGDYRLRAASPAVDFATGPAGTDLDGRPRNRDLDPKPNFLGTTDLGAWERQTLLPLLFNTEFDSNADAWTAITPGVASWDPTQNVVGATGSGAAKVTQAGTPNLQRVYGYSQCIHVPGPGLYALNGWGRAGAGGIGNRDYVYLNWEFRGNGGESCTSGIVDAGGDHFLSNSSNWTRPANPGLIDVPQSTWTVDSSITVTMVVVEFGVTSPPTTIGWVDGVTLEPVVDDTIFRNGFDPAL